MVTLGFSIRLVGGTKKVILWANTSTGLFAQIVEATALLSTLRSKGRLLSELFLCHGTLEKSFGSANIRIMKKNGQFKILQGLTRAVDSFAKMRICKVTRVFSYFL